MAGAERPESKHDRLHPSVAAVIAHTNIPLNFQGDTRLHSTEGGTLITRTFKTAEDQAISMVIGFVNREGEGFATTLTNVTPPDLRREIINKQIADGSKTHLTEEEHAIVNKPETPDHGGVPFN